MSLIDNAPGKQGRTLCLIVQPVMKMLLFKNKPLKRGAMDKNKAHFGCKLQIKICGSYKREGKYLGWFV
jgi:hypothetical protein